MKTESTTDIQRWRKQLHQHPELSGDETHTAQRIVHYLKALGLDSNQYQTGIGGHGVLAEINSHSPGPSILLRCELDALPIQEVNTFEHASHQKGVAHKCGHDGHMAILLETVKRLLKHGPNAGRVLILFQPAEETGAGAALVRDDPTFLKQSIDYAFALHNMPGKPLGSVIIKSGTMNCASRGMIIQWEGKTAHAAQPDTGHSPALALSETMTSLTDFQNHFGQSELAMATVVGANLGAKAFGTAPANATCFVTLRSESNTVMSQMLEAIQQQLVTHHQRYHLKTSIAFEDIFPATINTEKGAQIVQSAAQNTANQCEIIDQPIRWSEDFGYLIENREGALFGLGAGIEQPELHHPDYDFPDALIDKGADIFCAIIQTTLKEYTNA